MSGVVNVELNPCSALPQVINQVAQPEEFKGFPQNSMEVKRFFNNDDDFFHVTCHLDVQLKNKIVQGEFVDLEKLLPHDRSSSYILKGEHKLEWVSWMDMCTWLW